MGDGAWGVRTANMFAMFVTREVSQFIAWLKAFDCQEGRKQRADAVGRGERRAAWEAGGGERPQRLGCGCARGGARLPKHVGHVFDAGGVPAERLVEGAILLPRVASRGSQARVRGASCIRAEEVEGCERLRCTVQGTQGADCRLCGAHRLCVCC